MGRANFISRTAHITRGHSYKAMQLAKGDIFIITGAYTKGELKITKLQVLEAIMTHIKATIMREIG